MITFLKGVMWGFIMVAVIFTSFRGLWWLLPLVMLVGWLVDRVAKIITREFE